MLENILARPESVATTIAVCLLCFFAAGLFIGSVMQRIKDNKRIKRERADAIRKGMLDACFITAGVPNAALQELASASSLTLIPVEGAGAKAVCSEHPFYTKTVVPGGTYRGTDGDVQALSVKATLVVSSSLSDDVVYRMTKALFENLEKLGEAHPKGRDVSAPAAISGVTIYFHPGAVKYYRECGAM